MHQLYVSMYVSKMDVECLWFSGIPVGVYGEIFRRYGGDFTGEIVNDLSPER